MYDFIVNLISAAEAIVHAEVTKDSQASDQDGDYTIYGAKVSASFAGPVTEGEVINIAIPDQGKETVRLERGMRYLFFLGGSATTTPSRPWRVVDLSSPMRVDKKDEALHVDSITAWTRLATRSASDTEMQAHLLKMLRTELPVFQNDAARYGTQLGGWTEQGIDELIEIVEGKELAAAPSGNTRDFLVATIVAKGDVAKVTTFARKELGGGEAESLYYGLVRRKSEDVTSLVSVLLNDRDPLIQAGALELAGLTRRNDLLDAFEKNAQGDLPAKLHAALRKARTLVNRD